MNIANNFYIIRIMDPTNGIIIKYQFKSIAIMLLRFNYLILVIRYDILSFKSVHYNVSYVFPIEAI